MRKNLAGGLRYVNGICLSGMVHRICQSGSCTQKIRSVCAPPDLADVNFVLLQVDPEEFGVGDEIRNLDPHRLKFLEGEVFGNLPLPIHPLH